MYGSEFRLIFLKWDRQTWKHVIAMKHGNFIELCLVPDYNFQCILLYLTIMVWFLLS